MIRYIFGDVIVEESAERKARYLREKEEKEGYSFHMCEHYGLEFRTLTVKSEKSIVIETNEYNSCLACDQKLKGISNGQAERER